LIQSSRGINKYFILMLKDVNEYFANF